MSITAAATVVGGALALAQKIFDKARPVLEDIAGGVNPSPEKVAELQAIVARNETEIDTEEAKWDASAPKDPAPE